ncbi:type III restriction-modification system methyltransferase (adenine-specific)/adenine specific DNA methylase Mod [Moraxella macacae 0408225]|uniref:site-specific DNA-methyltransferase (adenine-specific) n=1 Tax=Moraxella macacae 0408225 TaxID=1230338 RepID=L2F6T9_9GAMM|nr:site-specific DNA-methyltransferase [Moraxella macacae]ELA08600.1 type III restriction-modification system methyltransferase (adenine-specific)/adenine specific DNA methylase Mod [Moraxella macacae 0408225]
MTLKMHTPNLVDNNITKLAKLFPNCITETAKTDDSGNVMTDKNGKILYELGVDFEILKQELSHTVIDGSKERYRLDWVGKREAIVTANSPIAKTLRPCRSESVDFDTTQNLFIEGDNLEALKILQESYLGKIKMIYIDPPYNTGNDFIYNDDFAEDTQEFFERSGQVDEEGNRLIANTESNGRFHSDWLSMMYSRLKLARNLLADDGVIFISIDDNEQDNVKKMCNEIFGESNFVANLIVNAAPAGSQSSNDFAQQHQYCLVYRKTDKASIARFSLSENELNKKYTEIDELGQFYVERLWKRGIGGRMEDVPTLHFPVYFDTKTEKIFIDEEIDQVLNKENVIKIIPYQTQGVLGRWTWSKAKMINERFKLKVVIVANEYKLHKKVYLDDDEGRRPVSIIDSKIGRTELGSLELKEVFNGGKYFDYPKSSTFIKHFIQMDKSKDSIILDFFAGSSTTAHAVMQLNAEDGGKRKFIMVQIPEATDEKSEAYKAGFANIADISKERIRRARAKIKADNQDKDLSHLDTGFRVLKIDTTNMRDVYYYPHEYTQEMLVDLIDNIKPDRTAEDLLFQFLLDIGVSLSLPIVSIEINNHPVYQVGNDENLIVASMDYIDTAMVNEIVKLKPHKFVTSERAIVNDSDKTNIKERFKQLSSQTEVWFI